MNDIALDTHKRSAALTPLRTLRSLPLLLAFGLVFVGCGDDSDGGDDKGGKGGAEDIVRFVTADETMDATVAVNTVNTFWFDDGGTFRTSVIGGWVNPGADFGTITARVEILGERGEKIPTGAYELTDSDVRTAQTAKLTFSHGSRELVLNAGTLTLRVIEGDVSQPPPAEAERLTRLSLSFEGTFTERGQAEPQAIEGEIVFNRE